MDSAERRSDIQTQAALILDMKKRLAEITAAQTGKTVEQINEDGDRDRWFNAQEALEYGFVDHIRELGQPTSSAAAEPPTSRGNTTDMETPTFMAGGNLADRMPGSRYILPSFEERTAYGFKRQDPYAKLFEDRIIFLGVQVDDASAPTTSWPSCSCSSRWTPTATSSCTSTAPAARSRP